MKSVQRENVNDGLPRREIQGVARFIEWCFGADVVHSMQSSTWGRRLVGAPRSALVIPDYSSLAQLKGSTPALPQPAAPAARTPAQTLDGDVLPKARGSARPSTIDLVPATPAPAPARAESIPRATPVFDVEVDLPEAVFPGRAVAPEGLPVAAASAAVFGHETANANAPEGLPVAAASAAVFGHETANVNAPEGLPVAAVSAAVFGHETANAIAPEGLPVSAASAAVFEDATLILPTAAEAAATNEVTVQAIAPALESLLAHMLLAETQHRLAVPLAPPAPEIEALLAQMLFSDMRFASPIPLAAAELTDAPVSTPDARHPRAVRLGPTLLERADVRISRTWLRPVPGVVLPPLVLVDAVDVAAPPSAEAAINPGALPAGEILALADWDADLPAGAALRKHTPSRLAPYAFAAGAVAILLAVVFLRPGDATTAAAERVPSAALALPTSEPGPTAIPSPTGLAASLSVVNPANRPTVAPAVTPATELALLAGSMAGRAAAIDAGSAISGTGGSVFPFNLDIVTPTPNSAAEQLLFRDPLVAAEPAVGVDAEGAPDYQIPVVSREQPVILPALESERNGGAAVAAASLDELVRPRILPAMEVVKFPDIATPIPTEAPPPTAVPIALAAGRQWSSFTPSDATHFWVGRPHPAFVQNQIAAPSYQFGSTGGGRYRPHHGMDIANAYGTPVRAATTGEVVHAGLDDPDVLGPYPNFYGNAVVIKLDRRLSVAGGEMDVYLLYGHLSEVTVQKGQRVQPDDIVGMVGMTGIAIGPHLHVEVRVGANTYEASVNPYLWVEPPPGNGAVAVRLLTADGRTWPNARVTLARFEGNLATWARVLENYPDNESVNPDPSFGETTAMDAVPAGVYYAVAVVNGERVAAEVTVEAGKTTFVEMRTQQ